MPHPIPELSTICRPRVLVQAARFAAAAGRGGPNRTVTRIAGLPVPRLLAEEQALDLARRSGDAGYSPTRHVEVLTALLTRGSGGDAPAP